MKELQLLGTSSCHLCERAEALLAYYLEQGFSWQIELLDIAESDALIEQWGEKIPVLLDPASGRVLCWPFDGDAVVSFVASLGHRGEG